MDAEKYGGKIPTNFHATREQRKRLEDYAKARGRSLSYIFRELIDQLPDPGDFADPKARKKSVS